MNHACPRFEPELSAYLDAETSPALRAEIDAHLKVCAACRSAVAHLRGVSRALRRWDAHETRHAELTGFRNRVFAQLGAGQQSRSSVAVWRAAAAVALVAAGVGGWTLVAPQTSPRPSPELERLTAEVARLRAIVEAKPARAPTVPEPSGAASDPAVERVERMDPLAPVVDASDDAAASPPVRPEVYEQHGDRRYLREALADHDDFVRERDRLELQQKIRASQETAKTVDPGRPTQAAPAPSQLATFLAETRVASGAFDASHGVQIWPIEMTGGRAADPMRAMTCEKAIQQNVLRLTESAVAENVVAENADLKRSVLVLAGDVLVGGAQDRVAREDVMVGPGEQRSISTFTCGRASRTSYIHFTSSHGVAPPNVRILVAADRALLSGGLGQDEFDRAVADTLKALATPDGRGSLDNIFGNPRLSAATEKYLKFFEKRLDSQSVVGLAVSAGPRLLGLEVFGDHSTFVEHRARVVRSYVLSALALSPDGSRLDGLPPLRENVVAMLVSASKAAFHDEPPTDSGSLSVFRGVEGGAFGFGLLESGRVVHAVMFPTAGVDATAGRAGRFGGGDAPADGGSPGESGRGSSGPARGGPGGDGVNSK